MLVPSVSAIGSTTTPAHATAAAAPDNDVYRYVQWHASERGPALLLPTVGPRIIPRTTSIRLSPQSKTIQDRVPYAEHFNGSRHGWNTTPSTCTDAESRLPTGHFRPTRLYK